MAQIIRKAWIVDVDGTVADLRHRLHYISNGPRNQAAFESEAEFDSEIEPVIEVVRALDRAGFFILFVSGRDERIRGLTETWLQNHGVPFDQLYMRKTGDTRADHIIKKEILAEIQNNIGCDIVGVIDDRQSVVDMWRSESLLCLQTSAPQMDFAQASGAYPQLIIMVGPSGAGKSTWLQSEDAKINYKIHPQCIISSDQVRMDLFGEIRVDRNDAVFEAVHTIARTRLKHGLVTAIDATHIRNKDRIAAAKIAGGICPVRYIVIDRPMSQKLADGAWRLDVKFPDGSNLIEKHDNTFRSNFKDILVGDYLPNVLAVDKRTIDPARMISVR